MGKRNERKEIRGWMTLTKGSPLGRTSPLEKLGNNEDFFFSNWEKSRPQSRP